MKKSFTLVETLIVIAVFGTGILAVLYGIAQTLGQQDRARTQITSSFLAREGIELMYHLRDSNYHKALPWNCIFQPIGENVNADDICSSSSRFQSWTVLQLAMGSGDAYLFVQTGELTDDFNQNFITFQLFYLTGDIGWTSGFQYGYSGQGGDPLWYARYVLIKPVRDGGVELPQDKLLKIESHVLFKKGELTGEQVMESFIGNYKM